MGFLRRLLGSRPDDDGSSGRGVDGAAPAELDNDARVELDEEERARELELARFEQDRTDDLIRRQQQYADRSWTPPAQGGERRSEDGDAGRS